MAKRDEIIEGVLGMVDAIYNAVPVVRCKECKEWTERKFEGLPAGVGTCRCNLMDTDAHFYCAYGERRED